MIDHIIIQVSVHYDIVYLSPTSPQRNVIEAASAGASAAISLVANIAVNLMAFISLLEFLNTVLTWMGHRAGMWPPEYPELTFEVKYYLLYIFNRSNSVFMWKGASSLYANIELFHA